MSSSDKEFLESREVKRGKIQVAQPFQNLIEWFEGFYGVRPLNICYEFLIHNQKPRLEIIFESYDSTQMFREDEGKNDRIEQVFKGLITGFSEYKSDNLFVIYSDFKAIAQTEANSRIDEKMIKNLTKTLNVPELWHIERAFGSTAIFFFHTQEQEDRLSQSKELKNLFIDKYFEVIKAHDEFGYLTREDFGIRFDNKERFQNMYKGSWQFYFKDN